MRALRTVSGEDHQSQKVCLDWRQDGLHTQLPTSDLAGSGTDQMASAVGHLIKICERHTAAAHKAPRVHQELKQAREAACRPHSAACEHGRGSKRFPKRFELPNQRRQASLGILLLDSCMESDSVPHAVQELLLPPPERCAVQWSTAHSHHGEESPIVTSSTVKMLWRKHCVKGLSSAARL